MEAQAILHRIARRLRTYKHQFAMDNTLVGRCVELAGDIVPLDGMRFSVKNPLIHTPHKSTILFGIYEVGERKFVQRYIRATDAVVELGGSIGIVSCTINRMLADRTKHVVVEANPTLIPTLQQNKELNHAGFTVVPSVVAYGSENAYFTRTGHFLTGSASQPGEDRVLVPTTTLKAVLEKVGASPVVLVSDIEGGELDVFKNELDLVAKHVRLIIMETHPGYVGAEPTSAMLQSLADVGFVEIERDGDVVTLTNTRLPAGTA